MEISASTKEESNMINQSIEGTPQARPPKNDDHDLLYNGL